VRFLNDDKSAAVKWDSDTVYFFKGSKFWEYNITADAIQGGTQNIASGWTGLASFAGGATNIDAAMNSGSGKVFFFKGSLYSRFDIATKTMDSGYPKLIEGNWSGLSLFDGGSGDLDAILTDGTFAYFFKGQEYIKFDLTADETLARYPRDISQLTWEGPHIWSGKIDAAMNLGNGKAFFFKEGAYIRFDIADDSADNGYPKAIDGATWPGLTGWYAENRLVSLGPVTPTERVNVTKLVSKSVSGSIPMGTQSIEVEILFRTWMYFSDGYADNVSVVLEE